MRTSFYFIFVLCLFLVGCNSRSEAIHKVDHVNFTIFYSNDIIGYLKPCG